MKSLSGLPITNPNQSLVKKQDYFHSKFIIPTFEHYPKQVKQSTTTNAKRTTHQAPNDSIVHSKKFVI